MHRLGASADVFRSLCFLLCQSTMKDSPDGASKACHSLGVHPGSCRDQGGHMEPRKSNEVSVFGLGYVGTVTAASSRRRARHDRRYIVAPPLESGLSQTPEVSPLSRRDSRRSSPKQCRRKYDSGDTDSHRGYPRTDQHPSPECRSGLLVVVGTPSQINGDLDLTYSDGLPRDRLALRAKDCAPNDRNPQHGFTGTMRCRELSLPML